MRVHLHALHTGIEIAPDVVSIASSHIVFSCTHRTCTLFTKPQEEEEKEVLLSPYPLPPAGRWMGARGTHNETYVEGDSLQLPPSISVTSQNF